jgi:glycosyltransferase involved in cell wall biosynthesis
MIEAMACGTPVIGFARGSVPEVIEEGVNGFAVNNMDEMIERIAAIPQIDRRKCRESAFAKFDVAKIGKQYLDFFNVKKRIVIITSGQPSANPRVVKEALALDEAGYRLTVL